MVNGAVKKPPDFATFACEQRGKTLTWKSRLDHQDRARRRKQALDWLRADLAARTSEADNPLAFVKAGAAKLLQAWKEDPDLAAVRNKDALDKLPESERADWQKLWSDVDALLKKSQDSGQK